MSIIIVGVGGADFDSMEELDSDKKKLEDMNGRKAKRDIVQVRTFSYHLGKTKFESRKCKGWIN